MNDNRGEYWDKYYRTDELPLIPSQFSAFVAAEYPKLSTVLELGVGNGRDVTLWRALGRAVVGVDQSEAAVSGCEARFGHTGLAHFVAGGIELDETWKAILDKLSSMPDGPVLIYARFFLHAIPPEHEDIVLVRSFELLKERGGEFCVEFRTYRDEPNRRETSAHFRRFILPAELIQKLHRVGFKVDYFVEGYGFAKYGADDAHVARVLASVA